MLEKIKKFVFKQWKIIIVLLIIIILILSALLIIFKIFINNDFYSSESEVANDSKAAMNNLYQDYEKSKASFDVYGDVTSDEKITMNVDCNGEESTLELTSDPVTVDNHCIISLVPNGGTTDYLSAYISTPDGSLITVNSYDTPELQLNAYKKETRIVLKNGIIYNRISKQSDDSVFTIQIGNSILSSEGSDEVTASADELDSKSTYDMIYYGYVVNGERYFEEIYTDTIFGIAGFQVITGGPKISTRGNVVVASYTIDHKHFIYYGSSTKPYETIEFTETGADDFSDYYSLDTEVEESFIEDQTELNENEELNFIGIAKHDENIDKKNINDIMKKYIDYYNKKWNEEQENKDDDNNNSNTNNKTACEIFKDMSGYTPLSICWCRNDFKISDNGLAEVNSMGYNYSKSDFIYCYTETVERVSDMMGNSLEGYMLKDCAIELGWPGTYSNEGGYVCN